MPRNRDGWQKVKRLVIDEISMVDGEFFDELESVARKVRGSKLPFGGIQLIICGDFLQLPPVGKGDERKKFGFQARTWASCMQRCVQLEEVQRQKDPLFIEILRRVRHGACTDDDIKTVRQGCVPFECSQASLQLFVLL